jgi:Flp pilus assembly protein TadB
MAMTERIKAYRQSIEKALDALDKQRQAAPQGDMWQREAKRLLHHHEKMVGYFQHERLVHLLIMLFFGVLLVTLVVLLLCTEAGIPLYLLAGVVLVLEAFYIRHYYFLENSIQKLYAVDDRLYEMMQ